MLITSRLCGHTLTSAIVVSVVCETRLFPGSIYCLFEAVDRVMVCI